LVERKSDFMLKPDKSFFDRNTEQRPEIIEGLIREGQLAVLGGPFGVGKSPALAHLTVSVLNGIPWCGRKVKKRPVAVIDFENSAATYIVNVKRICGRLNVECPKVPDELEVYMEQDSPDQPGTKELLEVLKATSAQKLAFLREILEGKPNALVIIDPLEMLFRIDTLKKQSILALYTELRILLANFPRAVLLTTFNLRKQDRRTGRPDLLYKPRVWLEEICGSLDIMNRSDVRLGMDFLDENEEIRVINGVRRGEEMYPLLIRPVRDLDNLSGFEQCPPSELDLPFGLTKIQREHWEKLPQKFRFEEVADKGVPRASLHRLIKRGKSLGILDEQNDYWTKVVKL